MAAPAITPRITPVGIRLEDGFSTLIAFAADPNVSLWEMGVKPPGIDGGDAIETTTMHNTTWRSMAARALKTLTESTVNAAYDPDLYNQLVALVNVEGAITLHFPDASTLSFFGFLKSADFDELVEGEMPKGTFTITPTNMDPVNHVEAAPLLTSVAGT